MIVGIVIGVIDGIVDIILHWCDRWDVVGVIVGIVDSYLLLVWSFGLLLVQSLASLIVFFIGVVVWIAVGAIVGIIDNILRLDCRLDCCYCDRWDC